MPEAYPTLRGDIDAAPASRDGETYYILYDRAGVVATRLLVSPLGLLIAGRLDGSLSILEVADALAREHGVACREVEEIVAALDEGLFLEGERFNEYHAGATRDFQAEPVRRAGSAGSAYPDDAERLRRDLDAMLVDAPAPEEKGGGLDRFPRGVIVPHIDFMRGGAGYGQLYSYLRRRPTPDTVVVVGTAHTPLEERYCLCDKSFATPLGKVENDRNLSAAIRKELAGCCDVDRDVLAHRGEHSIELQAVWLRHIYGDGVSIVPLLASSLGDFVNGVQAPDTALRDPGCKKLASVLAEAVGTGSVMLMASADLAHVGPRFGDDRDVCNSFLAEVEESDGDYLEALSRDPLSGLESLAAHGDRHHVCGTAAIFAVGMALFGARTHLLGYHQAVTSGMEQAVTYAAMVMD